MSQRSGVVDASLRVRADLRSPWSDLRRVLRYWAPLAAFAALVALIALIAPVPGSSEEPEARARLGLTQQVVWPFYDAARDRQAKALDGDGRAAAAQATGVASEITFLDVEVPINQSYVDVVVRATSAANADRAARGVAQYLISKDVDRITVEANAQLQRTKADLAALDTQIAAHDARLNELAAEQARLTNLYRTANDATAEQIDRQIRLLTLESEKVQILRGEALRSRTPLLAAQQSLELKIRSAQTEVELLRVEVSGGPSSTSRGPIAVAVALAALVAGSILALTYDRQRGRIRTSDELRDNDVAPLLGVLEYDVEGELTNGAFETAVALVDAARANGGSTIAVLNSRDTRIEAATTSLAAALDMAGYESAAVYQDAHGEGITRPRSEAPSRHAPTRLQWSRSMVATASDRATLAEIASKVELVLVEFSNATERPDLVASWLNSCDSAIVVVTLGQTDRRELHRLANLPGQAQLLGIVAVREASLPRPRGARSAWRFGAVRGHDDDHTVSSGSGGLLSDEFVFSEASHTADDLEGEDSDDGGFEVDDAGTNGFVDAGPGRGDER